jgi:pyridoxal phosphate enzyme (YggS family)
MVGMSIETNLRAVRLEIEEACSLGGRDPASVRLVAVSKTKSVEMVREALACGQRLFGENYVQEALEKSASVAEAEWHLIGSLQTNKVKSVVGRFALIHSVDRLKLAVEIARAAERAGVVQDILLQVHVGDEATKHGVSFDEAPAVIREILALPTLRLRGLMALPPLTENEAEGRAAFASVREALLRWRRELMTEAAASAFTELSMGTSSDFRWAILEGATLIRVGTSIFGAR